MKSIVTHPLSNLEVALQEHFAKARAEYVCCTVRMQSILQPFLSPDLSSHVGGSAQVLCLEMAITLIHRDGTIEELILANLNRIQPVTAPYG